jgi:GNAT superfamily N-acetyltransferase
MLLWMNRRSEDGRLVGPPALRMAASASLHTTSRGMLEPVAPGPARNWPRLHKASGVHAGPHRLRLVGAQGELGGVSVSLEQGAIHIHDLELVPPVRGMGLGIALLDSALRFGAYRGARVARLEADDDGSGRLLRWYARLGFVQAGVSRDGHPLMQLDIPACARIERKRASVIRSNRRSPSKYSSNGPVDS